VDLESDPEEHIDLVAISPEAAGFERRALSHLEEAQRGVRLEIRNRSPSVLKGRLRGAFAAHDRLKSASDGEASVRWRNQVPPTFVVPPGQRLLLLLDSPDRPRAGINAHIVVAGETKAFPLKEWFDLDRLQVPVTVSLTETGWVRHDDGAEPPEVGFRIWWEGGPPTGDLGAPRGADEMIEQLRALGYVE